MQRMTLKLSMKLLSPRACVKIRQWNVRTMLEMDKCAQVTQEMRISTLWVSMEITWEDDEGQTVLYSGMNEGEDQEGESKYTLKVRRFSRTGKAKLQLILTVFAMF